MEDDEVQGMPRPKMSRLSASACNIHRSRFHFAVAFFILFAMTFVGKVYYQPAKILMKNGFTIQTVIQESDQCRWVFDHYDPSPWESFWYGNITNLQNKVCATLAKSDEMNKTVRALEKVIQLQKSLTTGTGMTNEDDLLFSKLYYRYECPNMRADISTQVAQYIEPLIGLLRDPVTICFHSTVPSHLVLPGEAALQSKRFFLLGPSAPFTNFRFNTKPTIAPWLHQPGAQKILFDIGASLYNGQNHTTQAGTVIGARWFVDYFRSISLQFDRIIAYERSETEPRQYWSQIPEDVMGRLVFINNQVELSGKFNPWNVLQSIVKKEDYVIVKLDIDTPDIENALLEQVIRNSSISSLIDEMFFEMHVNVNEMRTYWGLQPGELKDSYFMFTKLRRLGIRMHSWP